MTNAITVKFEMSKSNDGDPPDLSSLTPDQRTTEHIRNWMTFSPNFGDVEETIDSYKILDDGLSNIIVEGTTISGYPSPIVKFELTESVEPEEFLKGVWNSSYKLEIPSINDEEPFFFEDHNGQSKVI